MQKIKPLGEIKGIQNIRKWQKKVAENKFYNVKYGDLDGTCQKGRGHKVYLKILKIQTGGHDTIVVQ